LTKHATAAAPPDGGLPPADDEPAAGGEGPPIILIATDEYRVNAAAAAALARESDLYQRAGMLVRVTVTEGRPTSPSVIRRSPGQPVIRELPTALLRERLTRCARWRRDTGQEIIPAHPPHWCISAVHVRGEWPCVRHLEAVVTHPVILADGSLVATDGYDTGSGLLVRLPDNLGITVPVEPSRNEVEAAVAELEDVVRDFPFQAAEHRGAWVAGLLTPLAWFAFDGPAPLFLIDKNVRGAGAGLLGDVIALTVNGRRFAAMAYSADREELRKRITTLAVEGERMVMLDNLAGAVGNDVLDAALTSDRWKDRLLGGNRVYDGPLHVVWYGTGNNVQLHADTARRVCHIRMESSEERPELRTAFKYPDLRAHVRANRSRLVSAALTILSGWNAAGRPTHGLPAWGSFEGWSGVVREAVVFAGLRDPGETRTALQTTADLDACAMEVLLVALEKMDTQRRGVTTAEIVDLVKPAPPLRQGQLPASAPPDWHGELRTAIEELCGKLCGRTLGYRFRHFLHRNFGGRMLDKAAADHGSNRWVVRPVGSGQRAG
jgi:hypothetical protein